MRAPARLWAPAIAVPSASCSRRLRPDSAPRRSSSRTASTRARVRWRWLARHNSAGAAGYRPTALGLRRLGQDVLAAGVVFVDLLGIGDEKDVPVLAVVDQQA